MKYNKLITNGHNEECYYYHLPEYRDGEVYDFDANFKVFSDIIDELENSEIYSHKPKLSKDLGRKIIDHCLEIPVNGELPLEKIIESFDNDELGEMVNYSWNYLDPIHRILKEHLFIDILSDGSLYKCGLVPEYVFSLNYTPEPLWN